MIDAAAIVRIAELEAEVELLRAQLGRVIGELSRERESKAAYCAAYHTTERDYRHHLDACFATEEQRRKNLRIT